jgi:hypothetical protein
MQVSKLSLLPSEGNETQVQVVTNVWNHGCLMSWLCNLEADMHRYLNLINRAPPIPGIYQISPACHTAQRNCNSSSSSSSSSNSSNGSSVQPNGYVQATSRVPLSKRLDGYISAQG